ncbi:Trehalose recp domain containing protein [Asbolus verrucosus]|uniref:Trehalose recp domain containing protein n=1 Tax=Asbolus verrucosus TaxID=1661398 RepID=A0A482VJV3_ASBVE|nr:Trehalose recp domain containing protein [Asbolus verrucosus]
MTSAMLSSIFFLKLAKDWSEIMKEWYNVESTMRTVAITTNLKRKLKILTLSFLALASGTMKYFVTSYCNIFVVEHFIIQLHHLVNVLGECKTVLGCLKEFYLRLYGQEFLIFDYALWKAFLIQLIMLRSTFSWTYVDVFIILISTAFVSRLKQLTNKVRILLKAKTKNPRVWKIIREEHYRLLKLCALLDDKLAYIILLSFATNLYFILVQWFGCMEHINSTVKKIYYILSFGLLGL